MIKMEHTSLAEKYDIDLIKKNLNRGDFKIIETRSKISITTITKIFNKHISVTKRNEKVLKVALKMIAEQSRNVRATKAIQDELKEQVVK